MATTKEKSFTFTKFTPSIIRQAVEAASPGSAEADVKVWRSITIDDQTWRFDNDGEFFALYSQSNVTLATYGADHRKNSIACEIVFAGNDTRISIKMPTTAEAERVFQLFEAAAPTCRAPLEKRKQQQSTTKHKLFRFTKFSPDIVQRAFQVISNATQLELDATARSVTVSDEEWEFDNDDEFFALYRGSEATAANYNRSSTDAKVACRVFFRNSNTRISVSMPTRSDVEQVFHVFESGAPASRISEDRREQHLKQWLRIFIGHGRSPLWRDLKDHLTDKHGFRVDAYETGARAGLHITDVLAKAKDTSGFAILVFTAENMDNEGLMHARENVIHESGLFQGKLGFKRAIVLLEDGCAEFSNLAGLQYIPFPRGNIAGTFGEIIATIHREFLDDNDVA